MATVGDEEIRHISLLCRMQQGRPHNPCSGTCDGHRSGKPCNALCICSCHGETMPDEERRTELAAEILAARKQESQSFSSCPVCRGAGKLDLRCNHCQGKGSVEGSPEIRHPLDLAGMTAYAAFRTATRQLDNLRWQDLTEQSKIVWRMVADAVQTLT